MIQSFVFFAKAGHLSRRRTKIRALSVQQPEEQGATSWAKISKKGRAKPRPRTREGHEFTRATKSQKWLRASAPEAQPPTPISAAAKQISSPAPTLEYDTALRSPSPADSASSNVGVGHSMHQTGKFSSANTHAGNPSGPRDICQQPLSGRVEGESALQLPGEPGCCDADRGRGF